MGEALHFMHRVIQERLAEVESLCARFRVRRLVLFGSAARLDPHDEPNDFDLLVEFETMTPVEHAGSYFGLLEGLEDLLEAPVDLVEAAAIHNPYFQQTLEVTQIPLYAAA
jgi:predicted nucleotidyltransferase